MAKTKTFYMRFYSTELFGSNALYLHELLELYKDESGKIVTPLISIGEHSHRIIIYANCINIGDKSLSGYFATYRDEAITKGSKSTGNEAIITFNPDEALVEKAYFSLFYAPSSEVLIFQNSRYGRINDLRIYLTQLFNLRNEDEEILLTEIGADRFDIQKILNKKPQYVEYRLAKPRGRYNMTTMPVWEQHQFEMMNNTGARAFTAKLSTRASGGLNKSATAKLLEEMKESQYIRKCKVKLEDIDTPIDLLADILKSDFTIPLSSNGTVNETFIFNEIRGLKQKYIAILKDYL